MEGVYPLSVLKLIMGIPFFRSIMMFVHLVQLVPKILR